jgi:twitching motility protein PilT
VSQQLLPRCDAPGRILACEVMIATPAVRNLIREHATEQIPTVLQTGGQYGMCTMDASLKALFEKKIISYEVAVSRMKNPSEFQLLGKTGHGKRALWESR